MKIYENRQEAAHCLAQKLEKFRDDHPIIMAIPRGAVPMASTIAKELGADLDLILVRKIGAPSNPEFAIGAISEYGDLYLSPYAHSEGISQSYLDNKIEEEKKVIKDRRHMYTPKRGAIPVEGRVVIIVDDGIATGATMKMAIEGLKHKHPKKIIVATPVAPSGVKRDFKHLVDEVIILETPIDFFAVGQFYRQFEQVSDNEVIGLMK